MNDDGRLAGNRASVTKFYAFNFNQGNRLQLVGADLRQLVSEENKGCWPGQQLFGSWLAKGQRQAFSEAGCTPPQIAAVTGHKSLRKIEHDIKAASQIGLADAAIATLLKTEREQKLASPEGWLANSGDK